MIDCLARRSCGAPAASKPVRTCGEASAESTAGAGASSAILPCSRQRARGYQEVATGLLRSPYSAAGPRKGLDRPPMLIDSHGL